MSRNDYRRLTQRAIAMNGSPTDLIQFGVLGVIVFLMLLGYLWPKPAVERQKESQDQAIAREAERADRAEAQRDDLLKMYQEQVLPILVQLNTATVPLLSRLTQDMHDIQVAQAAATNRPAS